MRNKKTTMRRAFIKVGDENFISIEEVASDASMRAAAIAGLKREIGSLTLAERRVAKNTLHFLRTMRDGTTNGPGAVRVFFAPIGKAIGGIAFTIRWTFGGNESAIRKTVSGIAFAVRWTLGGIESAISQALSGIASAIRSTLGGIEFAVRSTLGAIAFAIRKTFAGIEFAIRKTLRAIAFAIRKTLRGAAFATHKTIGGIEFAIRKTRGGVAHLFARMRRVFAPGT